MNKVIKTRVILETTRLGTTCPEGNLFQQVDIYSISTTIITSYMEKDIVMIQPTAWQFLLCEQ